MRVVLWCTAAVLVLSAVVATPAQAGFPSCRDVTEKIPSEYMEGRYLRVHGAAVQQWREWNGYVGLQTHKCETEYGVLIGSDTFVGGFDAADPAQPGPGELPDIPKITNPSLCRSGDDPTIVEIVRACATLPEPPGLSPSEGECRISTSGLVTFLRCLTDSDEPPAAAYINWLQYVLGWTNEG